MAHKDKAHEQDKVSAVRRAPRKKAQAANEHQRLLNPARVLERAASAPPSALAPADIRALHRAVGNRAVGRLLGHQPRAAPPQPSTGARAMQRKTKDEGAPRGRSQVGEGRDNRTGLPDALKAGVESLSGFALDDVRVHYNSPRPAGLQALASTQGSEIHVGPGQEHHLPHEAWHVVQQKQGRVKPTLQAKGVAINDDQGLEREADVMGAQALRAGSPGPGAAGSTRQQAASAQRVAAGAPVQLKSMQQVKEELTRLGIGANVTGDFTNKHLGMGKNTNMDAAKIHAGRTTPTAKNTVIMNAKDLKEELQAGTWVESGDHWEVTTRGAIDLQYTTRRRAQINDVPELEELGGNADLSNFTIGDNHEVTAIQGVTADELARAKANVTSPKPDGGGDKKKRQQYRRKLIADVNTQRRAALPGQEVAWVKSNFRKIGAKNLNHTVVTMEDINAIAAEKKRVKVFIKIANGNIYHFAGPV